MRSRLVGLCLVLLGACAGSTTLAPARGFQGTLGRNHTLVGKIWSRHKGGLVGAEQLLAALRGAAFVVLGETHDNPDHHLLEARLLEEWLSGQPRGKVAFEMLDETQAAGLAPPLPADADELARRVRWDEGGWPEFALYRPVFARLLAAGSSIVAAHPSNEHVRAVMRGESPELSQGLTLERPLPAPAEATLVSEIRESHCGQAPEPMVTAMVRAQSYKDAFMAAVLARSGAPSALVAGRGHAREDRAVPMYLDRQGVAETLTVALVDVDDARRDPADYDLASFDFALFTPRVSDESPCERFRAQLEQMKRR